MKKDLHIIESNNLFGLADNYNMEIVECVYDKIIPLTNGKYIVIKDKMGGILDSDGSILFILKPNVYIILSILIFFTTKSKISGGIFLFLTKIYFIFLLTN